MSLAHIASAEGGKARHSKHAETVNHRRLIIYRVRVAAEAAAVGPDRQTVGTTARPSYCTLRRHLDIVFVLLFARKKGSFA